MRVVHKDEFDRVLKCLVELTEQVRAWNGSRGIRKLDTARQLAELEILRQQHYGRA